MMGWVWGGCGEHVRCRVMVRWVCYGMMAIHTHVRPHRTPAEPAQPAPHHSSHPITTTPPNRTSFHPTRSRHHWWIHLPAVTSPHPIHNSFHSIPPCLAPPPTTTAHTACHPNPHCRVPCRPPAPQPAHIVLQFVTLARLGSPQTLASTVDACAADRTCGVRHTNT